MDKQVFLCQSLTGSSDGQCCFFHHQCRKQLLEVQREKRRELYKKALQLIAVGSLVLAAFLTWFVVTPTQQSVGGKVALTHQTLSVQLVPEDVFISVKTSRKFHRNRLEIIVKTWFQLASEHTWFFTDFPDQEFDLKTSKFCAVFALFSIS